MSFLEKRYTIKGWYGETYHLTAKHLCKRVLKDSQSNYDWLAPAQEIVKTCEQASFPLEYAIIIKIAILNCFANVEHMANSGGNRYRTNPYDQLAVMNCYNSLYGINSEEAISARKYYLTEIISTASDVREVFDPLSPPDPQFFTLREQWIKQKLEHYIAQETIDFNQLLETLRKDIAEMIQTAKSNGDFKEADADLENWINFLNS